MFFVFLLILCAVNTSCLQEGDFCTKEGVEGVCTNIKQCPDALEDIKNRIRPQHCIYGTPVPIVCCISAKATESPRKGCILPSYPEHGTYTAGVPIDKPGEAYETFIVNVTCDQGYVEYGPRYIFCRDGWWPEPMPECIPNSCRKQGVNGECTKLKNCPPALSDLNLRRAPKHCWFGSVDPIVCCVPPPSAEPSEPTEPPVLPARPPPLTTTTKNEVSSTTEYEPPIQEYEEIPSKETDEKTCEPISPALTSKPTGQKAWDKCLEYQEKLVFPCEIDDDQFLPKKLKAYRRSNRCHHNPDQLDVSGPAEVNEFPNIALLGFGERTRTTNLHWHCGGSLVSEKFILTAAHCTTRKKEGNVSYVQLAAARRSTFSHRDQHKVRRIIPHPQYDPVRLSNDIALLELEKPVGLDEFNVPACLYPAAPAERLTAIAAGWGLSSLNGTTSDRLQKLTLTKFNTQECAATYKQLMANGENSSQVCYGDKTRTQDTCQGEIGGPLMIKSKQIACMYVVVGISSYDAACGFVGVPGVYTHVPHYLDWIESVVWP